MDLDAEWESFLSNGALNQDNNVIMSINNEDVENNEQEEPEHPYASYIPKCSDNHISTKTMITYLNQAIDLDSVFWSLPVIDYHQQREGIIKKQMKVTTHKQEDTEDIADRLSRERHGSTHIIQFINNNSGHSTTKYKHTQKITVGLSSKQLLTTRTKEKSAFYNCFAIVMRIKYNGVFREIHMKVFNTGKMEVPGIQSNDMLHIAMERLLLIMQPLVPSIINYDKNNLNNVLINSNFSCNYHINRDKLFNILKTKYNMICNYDACTYPGIKCKFYYNFNKAPENNKGICCCKKQCSKRGNGKGEGQCVEVSVMIFRTGSILVVGNCDEDVLSVIYQYFKNILLDEYLDIMKHPCDIVVKESKHISKKRYIIVDDNK